MQKFNYHQHTYRCGHADLDISDEEYVKEYIKMGFKKVAFTDHCPEKNEIDKRPNMRMKYSQKDEYINSIKELKEKYRDIIEIETGYEVEYLPGEENNLLELKEETDKIVLGQHFVYDDNKELKEFHHNKFEDKLIIRYAEYIEEAMKLNLPDIIAHPDLYMLAREEFGIVESKAAHMICKSAEKYQIPLEINLNRIFSKRAFLEDKKKIINNVGYPYKEFWNIVKDYNVKVLYGIDVHHRGEILAWNELVKLANEIIGEDIIGKLNFVEEP